MRAPGRSPVASVRWGHRAPELSSVSSRQQRRTDVQRNSPGELRTRELEELSGRAGMESWELETLVESVFLWSDKEERVLHLLICWSPDLLISWSPDHLAVRMARPLLPLLLLLPSSLAQSSHCPPTHTPHFELVTGKVRTRLGQALSLVEFKDLGFYGMWERPKMWRIVIKTRRGRPRWWQTLALFWKLCWWTINEHP